MQLLFQYLLALMSSPPCIALPEVKNAHISRDHLAPSPAFTAIPLLNASISSFIMSAPARPFRDLPPLSAPCSGAAQPGQGLSHNKNDVFALFACMSRHIIALFFPVRGAEWYRYKKAKTVLPWNVRLDRRSFRFSPSRPSCSAFHDREHRCVLRSIFAPGDH